MTCSDCVLFECKEVECDCWCHREYLCGQDVRQTPLARERHSPPVKNVHPPAPDYIKTMDCDT